MKTIQQGEKIKSPKGKGVVVFIGIINDKIRVGVMLDSRAKNCETEKCWRHAVEFFWLDEIIEENP